MLQLKNITKRYGEDLPNVLENINIEFRENEFISILGPSGCGKTTLLNIIGGLDQYTSGDLIIKGVSTKNYGDKDWDAYRNRSIGFIFQSYNLIPHLSILENVSLALALSGINKNEQKTKAMEALKKVGLEGQEHKRPNQLSGGQMQRVAIARSIVNDPEILLADEPTGALDTKTSIQIMDLLKEIANERLVIMVTHNPDLAEKYSTRIINLLDGHILHDNNPYISANENEKNQESIEVLQENEEKNNNSNKISNKKKEKNEVELENESLSNDEKNENSIDKETEILDNINKNLDNNKQLNKKNKTQKDKKKKVRKTSMPFWTALSLSFKNLFSKKMRTILTAFAGSIGIIGIALVLSVSNGFNIYIEKVQRDAMSSAPISVAESAVDMSSLMNMFNTEQGEQYPDDKKVIVNNIFKSMLNSMTPNNITQEYIDDAIKTIPEKYVNYIQYNTGVNVRIFNKDDNTNKYYEINKIEQNIGKGPSEQDIMTAMGMIPCKKMINNESFIKSQYDIIEGRYPKAHNELLLVVNKYNQISDKVLSKIGLINNLNTNSTQEIDFNTIINKTYHLALNNDLYTFNNEGNNFLENNTINFNTFSNEQKLKIVGIIRPNKDTQSPIYSPGLLWTESLENYIIAQNVNSQIIQWMNNNPTLNPFTNAEYEGKFDKEKQKARTTDMRKLGAVSLPNEINIFASSFEAKSHIKDHLNAYNESVSKEKRVTYSDMMEMFASTMSTMIDGITYVLIAFTAISLIVSSIMIGIITYVSVIERTKEIGVLRSIGARKKDIARVFNAETFIIGLTSGLIGVVITFLLTFPINILVANLVEGLNNIAILNPISALILVVISVLLTIFSGLIPAKIASKKDPVIALRSE